MKIFHRSLLFILLYLNCSAACRDIPEEIKQGYASDIQAAFTLQSEGFSTDAICLFEVGRMKAMSAGEDSNKLEALYKLFVWYRTYGYFLGLIKKDPKIFGQYIGNGNYSSSYHRPRTLHSYGTDPQRDAKARDLLGIAEILTGLLCLRYAPPPYNIPSAAYLCSQGFNRAWDAANSLWLQKDISLLELKKTGDTLKAANM